MIPVTLSRDDAKLLRDMLTAARSLTEPREPNAEYIRGQAELICDVLGLDMERRDDIIAAICGSPFHVEVAEVI